MVKKQQAKFKVDTRLASVLGENYRSSEDALKELVDNSWDADAENVWITLPESMSSNPIIIKDDGCGMTKNELKSEYLNIASDRLSRKGEQTPQKKRLVKGRKGIGKFSGLAVADKMRLETMARGSSTSILLDKHQLLEYRKDIEKFKFNIRGATGTQPFVKDAPVNLVFVADFTKMGNAPVDQKEFYAAIDTGYVSQNVYLYCASEGLATVVRGLVDRPMCQEAMKLRPDQKVILAQTVGYPK